MLKPIACLALFAFVTACATGPRPLPRDRIERALKNAPGEAQPSKVVAAEIAFARAAREQGQWTAFRAFAAPGAIIHGRKGPVEASTFLAGLEDPEEAVRWNPRVVWMSCDALTAVSEGRFREPDGTVGTVITVWERQGDDEYRWVYDAGVRDDPQPPPPPSGPADENEIVVSALDAVQGNVSDCAKRGEALPAPPQLSVANATANAATLSKDGTLRWRWEHEAGAERRFVAEYLTGGVWEVAVNQPLGKALPDDAE